MKTKVSVHFDGNQIPGGPQAVLDATRCGPDVATVSEPVFSCMQFVHVELDETDPRLHAVRELLRRHGGHGFERHEDHYTEEELEGARLLLVLPKEEGQIAGGVEWGMTQDLSGACQACDCCRSCWLMAPRSRWLMAIASVSGPVGGPRRAMTIASVSERASWVKA